MPVQSIPLGIKLAEGRSQAFSSENLVNMYAEPARGQAKGQVALLSGPGIVPFATIGGGTVRGQVNINGRHFAVIGETLYEINSAGIATTQGNPVEGSSPVDLVAGNNALVIVTDPRSYTFGLETGTFSEILDPDFLPASSAAWLKQRVITSVKNSGRMQIFDINDETSVDPTNFVTAESNTDDLVAVRASNQELVAFGTSSIEFFRVTDDADDPLQVSTGAAAGEIGCISRDSICLVNNGLAWLGRDSRSGGVAVFRMNGYVPERISTHAIENQIERAPDFTFTRGLSYSLNGHLFYQLTIPAHGTYLMDFTTGEWSQRIRGSWPMGTMGYADDGLTTFAMNGEKRIVGLENGNLYELSLDAYSINGDPLVREFTTPPWFPDNRMRTVSRIELIFEPGVGLTSGQGSNPIVMMSLSKDGGRTWSSPREASLGAIGETRKRAYWTRLGSGRDWMAKFRVSDPVPFSVFGLAATYENGTS